MMQRRMCGGVGVLWGCVVRVCVVKCVWCVWGCVVRVHMCGEGTYVW